MRIQCATDPADYLEVTVISSKELVELEIQDDTACACVDLDREGVKQLIDLLEESIRE